MSSCSFVQDLEDFINTVINITFNPDEGNNNILVTVPIINDDINEAVEQVFVIQLALVSSVNPHMVRFLSRAASLCRIIDDDRK